MRSNYRRRETGAVAIMVAILATMLLIVAAMSVDLGNAWARKREVQTQVDVAALSAGHLLPRTVSNEDTILKEVADYLNESHNLVQGQDPATPEGLSTPSLDDGYVSFSDDYTMEVVAPKAWVDFALAGVAGFSGTDVTAGATVQIRSEVPDGADVLPFWVFNACNYGSMVVFGGHGHVARSAPAWAVRRLVPRVGNNFSISLNPTTVDQGTDSVTLTLAVADYNGNRNQPPTVTFTKSPGGPVTLTGDWTPSGDITVVIGSANVTKSAGSWAVTASSNSKSSSETTLTVVPSADPGPGPDPDPDPAPEPEPDPTACLGGQETGNFGSILSPRKVETKANDAYRLNVALGLDHLLIPFETDASACSSPVIPGEQLDDVSRDNNNCITGDKSGNGADGSKLAEGLVTGVDKTKENSDGMILGRLDGRNGHTRSACNGGVDRSVGGGISINNDVLSCFLGHGTLEDLKSPPVDASDPNLDPAVLDSPRFVWLPSVTTRANGWQPIVKFVPAFITDEDVTTAASSDNGVECQGSKCNTVPKVTVFTFHPDQLPMSDRSPTIDFNPGYGRGVVRLID